MEGRITSHAVAQWRQRVAPWQSPSAAHAALVSFLGAASVRQRPRKWHRDDVVVDAGCAYAYNADTPGVAVVITDYPYMGSGAAAVTVFTKATARARRRQREAFVPPWARPPRRPELRPHADPDEEASWSW